MTPSERRENLIDLIICPFGWLRCGEPLFRHWDRLPQKARDAAKELKSSDIENDNWHLR
jgi:hypothetical protein